MATLLSSFVFNVNSQTPPQIGPSLSASNNSVAFLPTDSTYKVVTYINKSVFTTLNANQLTAITTNSNISGFYPGWLSAGIAVDTKFCGTDYTALVNAYSIAALSTLKTVLTSSMLSTSEFGTGKIKGSINTPIGILFNQKSSPSTNMVVLSVADRIKFSVSQSYHDQIFGLLQADRGVTLFKVNTAATAVQVVSGVTYDVRSPNDVRRFALEL